MVGERMPAARTAAVRGWVVAGGVYFLAVFNRSSLGVAGLTAERRFGIGHVTLQASTEPVMAACDGPRASPSGPGDAPIAAASR